MKNKSILVSIIVIACFIGVIFYVINSNKDFTPKDLNTGDLGINTENITDNTQAQTPTESPDATVNMDQNTKKLNNFTPVSKTETLQKIDLVVGSGAEVKEGATVSVQYTGAVAATGSIFQSSKDISADPVTFPLGQVIKGWTKGIPGMKVGGIRRLVIPADMAYGSTPPPGSGIPANADLVFDVELISVQ